MGPAITLRWETPLHVLKATVRCGWQELYALRLGHPQLLSSLK